MKSSEDMLNSLLERREQYEIKRKRKRKVLIATLTPICSVCLVVLLGFGALRLGLFGEQSIKTAEDAVIPGIKDWFDHGETEETYEGVESEEYIYETEEMVVLASDNVWIYFVSGNEITREEVFLSLAPKEVFKAWKEKNGIGDEVKLIGVNIEDNSTTTRFESNGSTYIRHEVGDYFIYNLTVSKELENYYGKISSELLLDSLKQTMMNYSKSEYNEYNLILE